MSRQDSIFVAHIGILPYPFNGTEPYLWIRKPSQVKKTADVDFGVSQIPDMLLEMSSHKGTQDVLVLLAGDMYQRMVLVI